MYKNKNTKIISTKEALSKVQFICSRQEKCCSDIRKKLQNWNIEKQEQDEIIDSLVDDKFIDEKRYTGFYVRDKFRFNKWGRIKIAYHLKQKRVPEQIINEALNQIKETDYQESLQELLKNKLKSLKEDDPYQLKSKLFRFAQSRGFESQVSLQFIDKLLSSLK
ncbi:regulatory protein RecX [Marinifilum sp. RC60d5]|uniref:regulatory protein RecX n=1 Tax=Marinifilum sp. RC60d5 TaxID=3458414 RepID=UPI004035227F